MGNTNSSSNSNSTNNQPTAKPTTVPIHKQPYRPTQNVDDISTQLFTAWAMNGMIVIVAIIMIIVFHRLKHSIPYLLLQNIFVLDLFTALTPGAIWSLFLIFDYFGILIDFICRAVGFLHSFMYNTFLLNIAIVSLTQFLLYISPASYGKIFVNGIVTRIYILTVWAVGGLLAAAPINHKGGWGTYDKFESTCWLKWVTTSDVDLSYNIISVLLTVGPALGFTLLAVVFMVKGKSNQTPDNPSHIPRPDVILIAAIQLLIFFILWLALTIMNAKWNVHWSEVDYKVDLAFLFLFFARGFWNPIVCFAVSKTVRTAFVDLFIRCRCNSASVAPSDH